MSGEERKTTFSYKSRFEENGKRKVREEAPTKAELQAYIDDILGIKRTHPTQETTSP